MRDTLIEFMDSLRDYVAESGTNIAHDERESSEFVDIFLNQGQSLPIDSVSNCSQECEWKADTFDNIGMALTEYCEECGEKRDC